MVFKALPNWISSRVSQPRKALVSIVRTLSGRLTFLLFSDPGRLRSRCCDAGFHLNFRDFRKIRIFQGFRVRAPFPEIRRRLPFRLTEISPAVSAVSFASAEAETASETTGAPALALSPRRAARKQSRRQKRSCCLFPQIRHFPFLLV